MKRLYLYAVMDVEPAAGCTGLAGEKVEPLRVAGLVAAAAWLPPPSPTPELLRAHDAAVRRLAQSVPRLLPARFGQWVAGPEELEERLGARRAELVSALSLVDGCAQMTLRLFGAPPPAAGLAETGVTTPGARYLLARRQAAGDAAGPAGIEPLRAALDGLVRAEVWARGATPPLLGSLYHLVRRRDCAVYAGRLPAAAREIGGLKLAMSGPWPPYAFVPRVLA